MPALLVQRPFPLKRFHLLQGLCSNEGSLPIVVEFAVCYGGQSGVGADNKLRVSKVLHDLFFQWAKRLLLVGVPAVNAESQGNSIPIHEHSHFHNRIGTMLLAGSIFPQTAFLLDLEVVVGAVIVENLVVPRPSIFAELIQGRLNVVLFLAYDLQSPVRILQRVGLRLQE